MLLLSCPSLPIPSHSATQEHALPSPGLVLAAISAAQEAVAKDISASAGKKAAARLRALSPMDIYEMTVGVSTCASKDPLAKVVKFGEDPGGGGCAPLRLFSSVCAGTLSSPAWAMLHLFHLVAESAFATAALLRKVDDLGGPAAHSYLLEGFDSADSPAWTLVHTLSRRLAFELPQNSFGFGPQNCISKEVALRVRLASYKDLAVRVGAWVDGALGLLRRGGCLPSPGVIEASILRITDKYERMGPTMYDFLHGCYSRLAE